MLLNNQQLTQTLNKLIPPDSPDFNYFQFKLIDLVRHKNFLVEIADSFKLPTQELADFDQPQSIIRQSKKSEEWGVTYLLASFLQRYQQDNVALDFLGKYLQVLLLISYRGEDHKDKVKHMCVRVRMALDEHKAQHRILTKLIEIHHQNEDIESVFRDIQAFEKITQTQESSGEIRNDHLAQKIGQIRYAYEVAYQDRKAYRLSRNRKPTTLTGNRLNNGKLLETQPLDPKDSENNVRVMNMVKVDEDSNVADNEKIADNKGTAGLDNNFDPSKETQASSQLQTQETRDKYKHTKRNQFAFPTNTRIQTLENYQLLFSLIWQNFATTTSDEKRVYAVLLLCLLTGRSIKQIREELALDPSKRSFLITNADVIYRATVDVTTNRRDGIKPVRKSNSNFINFALPEELPPVIRYKFLLDDSQINPIIEQLREHLEFAVLSQQHFDNALSFIIKQRLNQSLHADFITGVDVKHSSGLYYTSFDKQSILFTYQQAFNLLTEKVFPKLVFELPVTKESTAIGSEMALNEETVKIFFAELADWVKSYNGKKSKNTREGDEYILQFQAYTIWLWFVFLLLTGIRPVNHAPGFLNQINLNHKLLWVSDKEVRQTGRKTDKGGDGRLIPLCDFLIQAIENYLAYIQKFAIQHNVAGTSKSFDLQGILNSEIPLLQFYNFRHKSFEGIKPKSVSNQLKDFIHHQDNWLRHQTRSFLTDKTADLMINALYGHELADQECWHPFSSMPLNEFKQICTHLQNIAESLDLEQIEVN